MNRNAPEWEVYDVDNGDESDPTIVIGCWTIEDAAKEMAKGWCTENGWTEVVRVQARLADSSDPWREFNCSCEMVLSISATEVQ